ncbi:MAG: T9SS type A sorting domain-containing protein [Bacteroidetes bacterium]|nr:T9SS type A sorting domain-containing protein [Bacteroidota bacterium]
MKKVLYSLLLTMCLSLWANFAFSDNMGIITIYNPNAGVQWVAGQSYNITWYYDHSYNVKIELLGPGPAVTTLIASTPNSSWTWNIDAGQALGTYQIRITSTANPATTTTSSSFSVVASDAGNIITLYRPVIGEQWIKGTTYPITWWSNVSGTMDIQLYQSDKTTLVGPIATNTANDGTENWDVPSDPAIVPVGDYYVKISSHANAAIYVWSGMFHVIAYNPNLLITIYRPVINENWLKGTSYPIVWWSNVSGNIDIQLYASDKTTLVGPIAMNTANDGTEAWDVPLDPAVVPAGDYYVKISSHDNSSIFVWSGVFHVIATNPNSLITIYRPVINEQWVKGSTYPITWWDNISGNIDIDLYQTDKLTLVTSIAANTANDGTENWTISSNPAVVPAGDYYVKITSHSNPGIYTWSDIFHVITTNPNSIITEYRPMVGENWIKGQTYPVVWWDNISGTIDIQLYASDKTTLVGPIALDSPNDGTENWDVPLDPAVVPAGDYYVKISSHSDAAIYAWSGVFHVISTDPNLLITLYRPMVGEEWIKGTTYPIVWWDNISGTIDIQLYASDKTTLIGPIAIGTPNDGTENWDVPLDPAIVPAGDYYVKISSHETPSIFVWSGVFHVIPLNPNYMIAFYRPVINEQWTKGHTYPIVWWDNFSGNVDIQLYQSDKTTLVGPIAMNTANDGTESWDVPLDPAVVPPATYYIKISSTANPVIFKWSDPFTTVLDGKKSSNGVIDESSDLSIYPNPATDQLNIKSAGTINHVWMLNNLGVKVLESSPNSSQVNLNLGRLNAGFYFLHIEIDGNVTTRKVMVK